MLGRIAPLSEASISILLLFYELHKSFFANSIFFQSFFAKIEKLFVQFHYQYKKPSRNSRNGYMNSYIY